MKRRRRRRRTEERGWSRYEGKKEKGMKRKGRSWKRLGRRVTEERDGE